MKTMRNSLLVLICASLVGLTTGCNEIGMSTRPPAMVKVQGMVPNTGGTVRATRVVEPTAVETGQGPGYSFMGDGYRGYQKFDPQTGRWYEAYKTKSGTYEWTKAGRDARAFDIKHDDGHS